MRLTLRLFLFVVALPLACGRTAPAATTKAPNDINESVAQINDVAARVHAAPGEKGPDPLMENACKGIRRDDAARLEVRLKQERESGALVVLVGAESQILSCSRYWKKLEGR